MPNQDDIIKILDILEKTYPDAKCALNFSNPLELLVATILSAQCTDERVNLVTRDLFRKYRSAGDYARAELSELEQDVRSTGFFRNKAKSIQGLGRGLVERHGGEVPVEMEKLVKLPGVGRKTANVVRGSAFGLPGLTVDTHVGRIAQRLGLTSNADPVKIEFDLMALIPEDKWTPVSHQLIWHGRRICAARKPACLSCPLLPLCPTGRQVR